MHRCWSAHHNREVHTTYSRGSWSTSGDTEADCAPFAKQDHSDRSARSVRSTSRNTSRTAGFNAQRLHSTILKWIPSKQRDTQMHKKADAGHLALRCLFNNEDLPLRSCAFFCYILQKNTLYSLLSVAWNHDLVFHLYFCFCLRRGFSVVTHTPVVNHSGSDGPSQLWAIVLPWYLFKKHRLQ